MAFRKKKLMSSSAVLKAQEDADKLRSVVMPLEQEITALKAKLTSSEDKVKELEASKVRFCFFTSV